MPVVIVVIISVVNSVVVIVVGSGMRSFCLALTTTFVVGHLLACDVVRCAQNGHGSLVLGAGGGQDCLVVSMRNGKPRDNCHMR